MTWCNLCGSLIFTDQKGVCCCREFGVKFEDDDEFRSVWAKCDDAAIKRAVSHWDCENDLPQNGHSVEVELRYPEGYACKFSVSGEYTISYHVEKVK